MFEELLEHFKENFMNMVTSRLLVLMIVIMGMGGYLISRIFQLQIVDGEEYYNNFQLKITEEIFLTGMGNFLPIMNWLTLLPLRMCTSPAEKRMRI